MLFDQGINQPKVLAQVGGKTITSADVDAMIASMGSRGQNYQSPQGRAAVLEQLIGRQLILTDAKRNLMDREPGYLAELDRVKDELLAGYAIEKLMSKITVTETDARKFYDENPSMFQSGETVNASHILVDTEDEANALLTKLDAGELTFEEAAKAHSKCPSAEQGGSLGEFGKGQMVPEFDQACFSMTPGEIKGPVKTQFGYHIIRLNSKSDAKPLTFNDVKEQIIQHLTAQKQSEAYQSKVNQLKILYPVDKF